MWLLAELRSRQSKSSSSSIQKTGNSDGKNENRDIKSSSRDVDGTAAGPNNPSVAEVSQPVISAIGATKKNQVIEVCLGPDCAVAGGGAALLEIEDLVRQQLCPNKESNRKGDTIIVQAGGCRDQCTEGPNVRILSSNGGVSGVDFDFHKVNSPEACRLVVRSLCPREDTPANNEFHAGRSTLAMGASIINDSADPSSDDSVVARLLRRKEDATRWKAHRERAAKERRLQAISRKQGDKNEARRNVSGTHGRSVDCASGVISREWLERAAECCEQGDHLGTKADLPFSSLLDELCEEDCAKAETEGKYRELKRFGHYFREHSSEQMKEYYCKNNGNGNNWSVLDFVDLPMSLAMRLNDDDVGAILICIDGKNELEQLTLTHCTNVIGYGLEPLRSSTRLKVLNLGLARMADRRGEDCVLDDAKLSEGPICGVVDGILSEEGNALKRLQFPYIWCVDSTEPGRRIPISFRSERMEQFVDEHSAFVNKFACCVYFGYDKDSLCSYLRTDSDQVDDCRGQICGSGENGQFCSECNELICYDCYETTGCIDCGTFHCLVCTRNGAEEIQYCENASSCGLQCNSCRLTSCRIGANHCLACKGEVFDTLLDECNSKQVQIDSQKDELERLRSIIEEQERTIQANQKFSTK